MEKMLSKLDFSDRMRSVDMLRAVDNMVIDHTEAELDELIKEFYEDGRFKNIPMLLELLRGK